MVVANNAFAQQPTVIYPYSDSAPLSRPAGKTKRAFAPRRLRRISASVLVVIMALVVVYRYGQINEINMQVNEQTRVRDALLGEQRHLKITLSSLSSLARIEQVAIEELGMKYPAPGQIRYVGGSKLEGGDGDGS